MTYKRYIKWGETDVPGVYALGVITVLQTFFLLGLTHTVSELLSLNLKIESIYGAYLALMLLGWNYWHIYKKIGKPSILSYWEKESTSLKKKMSTFMVLHFVLSFGLMVIAIVIKR